MRITNDPFFCNFFQNKKTLIALFFSLSLSFSFSAFRELAAFKAMNIAGPPGASQRKMDSFVGVLVLLALTSPALAQSPPSLNLDDSAVLYVEVGTETHSVALVSGTISGPLVSDPDGAIGTLTVVIAEPQSSIVEDIAQNGITLPASSVSEADGDAQTFTFTYDEVNSTPEQFSTLLSFLSYSVTATDASAASAFVGVSRTVNVTVNDTTGLSDSVVLTITLVVVNEFAPQFDQLSYSAFIDENSPLGASIPVSISASDAEGLDVQYSFGAGSSDAFAIDSASGTVTVDNSSRLDRETTPNFVLTVVATDVHQVNSLSNTTTLTITLQDLNDEPPVFGESEYFFDPVEEEVFQPTVGTVMASDPDEIGSLSFFFQPISSEFIINANTGQITVATTLDADPETGGQTNYQLTVAVFDGIHTSFATVNVNVTNILDQRPFITPTSSTRLINLDIGQTVLNLTEPSLPLTVQDDATIESGTAVLKVFQTGLQVSYH